MDALRNADLDEGPIFDDETDFFILPTWTPVLGEAPQLPQLSLSYLLSTNAAVRYLMRFGFSSTPSCRLVRCRRAYSYG